MADNRRAYGLAKGAGINTEGMSPKEVWDALRKKGITGGGESKDANSLEKKFNTDDNPFIGKEFDGKLHRKSSVEETKDKRRNQVSNVIDKLKSYSGKPVGTYNYNTGKLENLTDGYMVTFHQNEPDENGHYKSHYGRYTSEEYDKNANEFAEKNNAEIYIGVFDNEPEISFKVKTRQDAERLMKEFNQDSAWDNKRGKPIRNKHRDKTKNPLRGE